MPFWRNLYAPTKAQRDIIPTMFKYIAILILITFIPELASGQQQSIIRKENFSLQIGERTWLSHGKSDHNHADSDGFPNVVSELIYDDVDSTVVELTADALFHKKYILNIDVGFGVIRDGTLTDRDYLGNNRTGLFSVSKSTVDDDDMFYVNADIGYRILSWGGKDINKAGEKKNSVDLLIGYQHWEETYTATKAVQTQDPFNLFGGVGPFANQGKAITEEDTWDSLRIGARTSIEIFPKLSIKSRLIFVPWTHYENKDIHHQRTDLKQNPSFETRADGGFGVMSDTTLTYNIWQGLSIEAGYQIWDIESGSGTITSRAFTGDVDARFNEANATRQGAIIGINYRF